MSDMTDETDTNQNPLGENPLGRALDVLLYAPLGAGIAVLDAVPGIVQACTERGKAEIARHRRLAEHHATQFHSTGRFAWSYGLPKLRNRAGQRVAAAQRLAAQLAHSAGVPRPEPPRSTTPSRPAEPVSAPIAAEPVATAPDNGARQPSTETAPEPASSELPIPGYDALSASQVVERLAGLSVDELSAVEAYETAHRKRRTILGKIEQLAARA